MSFFFRLSVVAVALFMGCAAFSAENDSGWSVVSQSADLTIRERAHEGSRRREVKAVGTIDVAPDVVMRVLEDVGEFPRFMPYVLEALVLPASGEGRLVYQRISAPLVEDRDYTLRIRSETQRAKDGAVAFVQRWTTANELGPAEKRGVVRVRVAEGSWLLEPAGNGRTMATYTSFSDPGGKLPAFVANKAAKESVRKLFAAIRKQARLPKYAVPGA
jgi:hypothetical protein